MMLTVHALKLMKWYQMGAEHWGTICQPCDPRLLATGPSAGSSGGFLHRSPWCSSPTSGWGQSDVYSNDSWWLMTIFSGHASMSLTSLTMASFDSFSTVLFLFIFRMATLAWCSLTRQILWGNLARKKHMSLVWGGNWVKIFLHVTGWNSSFIAVNKIFNILLNTYIYTGTKICVRKQKWSHLKNVCWKVLWIWLNISIPSDMSPSFQDLIEEWIKRFFKRTIGLLTSALCKPNLFFSTYVNCSRNTEPSTPNYFLGVYWFWCLRWSTTFCQKSRCR